MTQRRKFKRSPMSSKQRLQRWKDRRDCALCRVHERPKNGLKWCICLACGCRQCVESVPLRSGLISCKLCGEAVKEVWSHQPRRLRLATLKRATDIASCRETYDNHCDR